MWSFARVQLNMQPPEFFRLTFRQWDSLHRQVMARSKRQEEMVEVMVGQLIAMVANTGFRSTSKDGRQPQEFMPSLKQAKPAEQRARTRKQRAARIARVMEQAKAYQNVQVARGFK